MISFRCSSWRADSSSLLFDFLLLVEGWLIDDVWFGVRVRETVCAAILDKISKIFSSIVPCSVDFQGMITGILSIRQNFKGDLMKGYFSANQFPKTKDYF